MGEQMSPNDVEKNWGKIEEYMGRAEKIVDSPNAWFVSEFSKGSQLLLTPDLMYPSPFVSLARDGYITGHVAELRNGFRRTDSPTSSTCIVQILRITTKLCYNF